MREVFQVTQGLLSQEDNWSSSGEARTFRGRYVTATDPEAERWSLDGAIKKAAFVVAQGDPDRAEAIHQEALNILAGFDKPEVLNPELAVGIAWEDVQQALAFAFTETTPRPDEI